MTLTKSDVFLGTPAYVAPEMIQGHTTEPIDHRVDIYEFGVVLFQMLSGDIPFKGSDYWSILLKHIEEPLPLLSPMNPTIPPTVDAVIQKATAKRPEERFASAGEFARALRTALTLSSPIVVDPGYAATNLPTERVAQRPVHIPSPSSYSTTTPVAPTLQHMASTPLPYTVGHPVKQPAPPHLKPVLLLMLLAVLLAVLFTGILRTSHTGSPQPTPTPAPTLPPVLTQSVALVEQYYNDLNQRDYMDAHALRTDVADYCSFTNSYAATVSDKIQVDRALLQDDGTSRIEITIYATEVRSSGEVVVHTYRIYHIVQSGKIIGGGNIGSGPSGLIGTATVIAEPTTAATPSQQAGDIVQEFYDDINQRNYPQAYNLLGKSFQSTMSYCQFVAGYAGTKHDQIVFDTVAPLPDGTVDVEVTIDAEASTGGHSSYQWNGIVGQEDGSWKILKATQQQVS
jgi:hypothetical protein